MKKGYHQKDSYRDLHVWQKAMLLVEYVYQLTTSFPKEEIYGLTSQLKRAVVSIPSNIAEGCVRRSTKEFMRFITIALGSVAEVETQLDIAKRLRFISDVQFEESCVKANEIGKMLSALHKSLLIKSPREGGAMTVTNAFGMSTTHPQLTTNN